MPLIALPSHPLLQFPLFCSIFLPFLSFVSRIAADAVCTAATFSAAIIV
jgi:hypothetical protein